jgi:hypothetical protein
MRRSLLGANGRRSQKVSTPRTPSSSHYRFLIGKRSRPPTCRGADTHATALEADAMRRRGRAINFNKPSGHDLSYGSVSKGQFNGDWRIDQNSLNFPKSSTAILLKDRQYSGEDAPEGTSIKADGIFHRLQGDPYSDEEAVTVINDRQVKVVERFKGKDAYVILYTVSDDGETLRVKSSDLTKPDAIPVMAETVRSRLGAAIRGAHLISGNWRMQKVAVSTESYLRWRIRLNHGSFSNTSGSGYGYTAKIGGPSAIIQGDSAGGRASITMPRPDTVIVSESLDGVIGGILTLNALPDGKTITATSFSVKDGTTTTFRLHRMP